MNASRTATLASAIALIGTLAACGGGGGGGTAPVTYSSVRLEAVQTGSGSTVDPTNIFTTDTVTFRLTGIASSTGVRGTIPTTGWTQSGVSGGTIAADGVFTATTPSSTFGTVAVTYNGTTYSSAARVVAPQAILRGRCRTSLGVPGARITFQALLSNGSVAATGLVASDGTIRASVPPNATRFTLNFQGVDPSGIYYVRQFLYNTLDYSTAIAGCTATLPSLTNGATSNLATDIVVYRVDPQNPPPPPTGC